MDKQIKPFFARFLEKSTPEELPSNEETVGGKGNRTRKYPSDGDEFVTLKYPSDDDEGGVDI